MTNRDTVAHSIEFSVHYFRDDKFLRILSQSISMENLAVGETRTFAVGERSGLFTSSLADSMAKAKIYSIDGHKFDTDLYCVRNVSWFSRSEECKSDLLFSS